jgi:NAD(P)-dependent dehydrogenase (short-subunit alcohol dehydrogenase family)
VERASCAIAGDLDAAAARVAAEGIGRNAIGLALDVTDRAGFESFMNEVEHRLGPLDVMVNNADIQHVGLFREERVKVVDFATRTTLFDQKRSLMTQFTGSSTLTPPSIRHLSEWSRAVDPTTCAVGAGRWQPNAPLR